jgi:RNA polymerase sigma factor (sigma-70 family)
MSRSCTRKRGTERDRLYEEFASYYKKERCCWAPGNPARVFELAFSVVRREYGDRLSPQEIVGAIYLALGTRAGSPRGLFTSFDPSKYHGRLAIEDHFVNMLARRVMGVVTRELQHVSGDRRQDSLRRVWDRRHLRSRLSAREYRLLEAILEAMWLLEERERELLGWRFRDDLSNREIGRLLGIDHKTVGVRLASVLQRLRQFTEVVEVARKLVG